MRLKFLPVLILLSLSLLLFSCEEQPTGLFFSIEQERLIDDKNLNNDLTAGSLVVIDLDNDGEDNFVLAGGKIYHSRASADRALQGSWSSLYHLGDDYLSYHVFVLGTDLYGLFYDKNASQEDSGSKLYRFNIAAGEWEIVTDGNVNDLRLEDGVQAGNYLYFSSYTLDGSGDRTYSLKKFDGATINNAISETISSRGIRLDAAANGTDVFLIYGSLLLHSSDTGANFSPADAASLAYFPDAESYRGIYYSDLRGRFLLSAGDGSLWYYDTDLVWKEYNDIGREAFDFQDFDHQDPDVSLVMVGSSRGYFEMETGASEFTQPEASTNLNNYLTLDFSQGAVRSLYSFSEGGLKDDVLFALTSGNGLWSLREEGGSLVWNQE